MAANSLYYYRKSQGLCVTCGEVAIPGRTRCIGCAQIEMVKAQMRRDSMTDEEKERQYAIVAKWRKEHPERMEEYRNRKSEYNKRYRSRLKYGYEL